MNNLAVTPILFHYDYLDRLARDTAAILGIDPSDQDRFGQLKLSVFSNFNRYLVDSLSFLTETEIKPLLEQLVPAMQSADESRTLAILQTLDFFGELRGEFLEIIRSIKK